MTANVRHLPLPARRPTISSLPNTLPNGSVSSLAAYRLRLEGSVLVYGNSSQKLTREEAGDLSQAIYWAGVTATASKASSATVAGIKVVAKGRTVEFVGFGRPISKKSADVLIAKLHDVYRGVFRG